MEGEEWTIIDDVLRDKTPSPSSDIISDTKSVNSILTDSESDIDEPVIQDHNHIDLKGDIIDTNDKSLAKTPITIYDTLEDNLISEFDIDKFISENKNPTKEKDDKNTSVYPQLPDIEYDLQLQLLEEGLYGYPQSDAYKRNTTLEKSPLLNNVNDDYMSKDRSNNSHQYNTWYGGKWLWIGFGALFVYGLYSYRYRITWL